MLRYIGSLIVVSMLCLGSSAPAWAGETLDFPKSPSFKSGTTLPITDGYHIVTPEETRASLIRKLAKSGEICRVLGHKWEFISRRFFFKDSWLTDKSCAPTSTRRCVVCDRMEEKVTTERWEVVKP